MKIIKKPWFIPIMLTIVILTAGGFYIKYLTSNPEILTEPEIRKQLEETYGGKVERLSLNGVTFEAELSRDKDVYLAAVDAETGKVLSLIQTKEVVEKELPIVSKEKNDVIDETKKPESSVQENVQTGATTSKPEQPTPSKTDKTPAAVLISENQAIKIALSQLKGEVEDVEFVQTNDGGYYLVEIDDNRDDEATFQIHAISGKILSVTRDD